MGDSSQSKLHVLHCKARHQRRGTEHLAEFDIDSPQKSLNPIGLRKWESGSETTGHRKCIGKDVRGVAHSGIHKRRLHIVVVDLVAWRAKREA